jgi:hypothetical protein
MKPGLYQRLQNQILDGDPTGEDWQEQIRSITITNTASEHNMNPLDRVAALKSGGFQGHGVAGFHRADQGTRCDGYIKGWSE